VQELEAFAHFLRERRQTRDLTQRELADLVGCALSTITKLERAGRRPSKQMLALLADALELTQAERTEFAQLARTRPRVISSGGPILDAARPALVGRLQEWKQLQELWEYASAGAAHLVVLTGDVGIGKTRLADELLARVQRQGYAVASAQLHSADISLAYRTAILWVRSESVQSTLLRMDRVWLKEIGRLLPELLEERADLAHSNSGPVQSWQRGHLFEALARAVMADRTPRLLVLDDMQWCDRETLDWLSYLLRFDLRAPLLVAATLQREELTPHDAVAQLLFSLSRSGCVTEIELGPLNAAESALLATQIVGRPLDPTLRDHIYRESEGNPLFIIEVAQEESLRMATGNQAQFPAPARPRPASPPTVQAIMQARLAQLKPEARALVELAATVGAAVSFEVLSCVAQADDFAVARTLDELCQHRILREVGEDAYQFTHHKLGEVAYTEIGHARRRTLHERVAQALETIYADDLDEVSAQIARHYERAHRPEKALLYYQRAAQAARRRSPPISER
jgi:predicted ATPase/DNA-binding XRE family transcriptional regulator